MDLNGCLTRNIGTELGDICIKSLRELLNTVQAEERIDMLDELLEKRDLHRTLWLAACIARFVHCRRRNKLNEEWNRGSKANMDPTCTTTEST